MLKYAILPESSGTAAVAGADSPTRMVAITTRATVVPAATLSIMKADPKAVVLTPLGRVHVTSFVIS